jgi:hypothetical protein
MPQMELPFASNPNAVKRMGIQSSSAWSMCNKWRVWASSDIVAWEMYIIVSSRLALESTQLSLVDSGVSWLSKLHSYALGARQVSWIRGTS